MKFMLPLNLTNSIRPFQVLSIVAMILTIAPTAQAAPRSIQRLAMQDQSLCFIQLPGKATTTLDKFCGLGSKGKVADQNGVINLDIDVNRDGISDQLLEVAQQFFESQEAASQRSQTEPGFDANPLYAKLSDDFNARMPYSNQVKQLFTEERRILEQFGKSAKSDQKSLDALAAKQAQIYQKVSRDPSYIKVEAAQRKVYKEIERRGSAQWLFGKKS
jgi:hypothetical protein